MKELTERQREVYLFIVDYREKHGYSPSFSEIGKGCYMSRQGVCRYIEVLTKKGYIDFTPRVARSLVIK